MSRVTIEDGWLLHDGVGLGSAGEIYVDTSAQQRAGRRSGLVYLPTPHHIDILMAVGGRVVGMESKTWGDLDSSRRSGRLSRQLGTLLECVDVSVLLVRDRLLTSHTLDVRELWLETARWQAMGAFVLEGPPQDELLAGVLAAYCLWISWNL